MSKAALLSTGVQLLEWVGIGLVVYLASKAGLISGEQAHDAVLLVLACLMKYLRAEPAVQIPDYVNNS